MSEYFTVNSPEAFVDFPAPATACKGKVVCPKCKGYGGWNLELNAYPLHARENTAGNRHTFCHFRASCSQCHGHGTVYGDSKSATCIHDYRHERNIGRCLNLYKCTKCGQGWEVDSSD